MPLTYDRAEIAKYLRADRPLITGKTGFTNLIDDAHFDDYETCLAATFVSLSALNAKYGMSVEEIKGLAADEG